MWQSCTAGGVEHIDGKLYLNYDKQVREDWKKDTEGRIHKADQNWPRADGDIHGTGVTHELPR